MNRAKQAISRDWRTRAGELYTIDRVLARRDIEGKPHYLVSWQGPNRKSFQTLERAEDLGEAAWRYEVSRILPPEWVREALSLIYRL